MSNTDLVYALRPPEASAVHGTEQATSMIKRSMTYANEQERLREQRSMAARMTAIAQRKKRIEMSLAPEARAVPGIVEKPFCIPMPDYLSTYMDQQLTIYRKSYALRVAVSRTESKALERAAEASTVPDVVDAASEASTEVHIHHKQEFAEIQIRDCVIRLNELCPDSFNLLPEQTKGEQDGQVCPKSVSILEPMKIAVCSVCSRMHAVQMNAVPPRPVKDDDDKANTRSVWKDFEIHVTTEMHPQSSVAEADVVMASDPAEIIRAATSASKDIRCVAMSEDHRLIGMISPESPSCVLIKRMSDGKILQRLEHAPHERIQMLDLTPDGALSVASIRSEQQGGECTTVIWSNMSGEQLVRIPMGNGKLLLANTSRDSKRIFVLKIGEDDNPELSVHFLNAGETAEAFETGNQEHSTSRKNVDMAWKSGDASAVLFSNGIVAYKNDADEWQRFNLHHFFAYKKMHSSDVYKSVFMERVKNDSDRLVAEIVGEFGGVGPAGWKAGEAISTFLNGSIALASVSHDGRVLANTFEMRFAGNEQSEPRASPCRLFSDARTARLDASQCSTVGVNHFDLRLHPCMQQPPPPHICVLPEPSTVVVWDLKKEEIIHRFPHRRPVTAVSVSGDGRLLVVGVSGSVLGRFLEQAEIAIYSLVTRQLLWRIALNAEVEAASVSLSRGLRFRCFGEAERAIPMSDSRVLPVQLGAERVLAASVTDDGKFFALKLRATRHGATFTAVRLGPAHPSLPQVQTEFVLVPAKAGASEEAEGKAGGRHAGRRAVRERLVALDVGKASAEQLAEARALGPTAISSDGSLVAVSVRNKRRVVVVSVSSLTILNEFSPDWEPKAVCVVSEVLTVCSDEQQHINYLQKDYHITTYSVLTGLTLQVYQSSNSGRTVGICRNGERRVQVTEDQRTLVEITASAELLYDIEEPGKRCVGVSGLGSKLVMWDAQQQRLSIKDLFNFDKFGPSIKTIEQWLARSGETEEILTRHKRDLEWWPLWGEDRDDDVDGTHHGADDGTPRELALMRNNTKETSVSSRNARDHSRLRSSHSRAKIDAAPRGTWSTLLSELVRRKDLASVSVVAEACPVFWAAAEYVEEDGQGRSTFFEQALASNDKLFSQLLLDTVSKCVADSPETVPVLQMEQVTQFIVKAIAEDKVQDKIELFLANLQLIPVPEDDMTIYRARFKDGNTLTRQWRTRDVPSSSFAWTIVHVQEEEEGLKQSIRSGGAPRERGYPYVSPLPDLAAIETVEAFVSGSPGLVDNETMRATIDALKHLMTPGFHVGPIKLYVDPYFMLYLLVMGCFCCFAGLAVLEDAKTMSQLADTAAGRAGIVLGVLAACGNLFFLAKIGKEISVSPGAKEYCSQVWHLTGPVAHLLCVVAFILRCADASDAARRGVTAVAMIVLWVNVFNYLRAFRKLSSLVTMLIQIGMDMIPFSFVMAVLIISFAAGFYTLHGKIEFPNSSVFRFLGHTLTRTFLMSVLGDFGTSDLQSPMEATSQALSNISYVLFFLLEFLVLIVGMNALIAIMGNTFAEVTEKEQAVQYHEISVVLLDRMRLMSPEDRRKFAQKNRWTHVLSPSENGSLPEGGVFGVERVNPIFTLKKDLKDSSTTQQDHIQTVRNRAEALNAVQTEGPDGDDIEQWSRDLMDMAKTEADVEDDTAAMQHELEAMNKKLAEQRKKLAELERKFYEEPEWATQLKAEIKKLQDVDPLEALFPPWAKALSSRLNTAEMVETLVGGLDHSRQPEWARKLDTKVTALEHQDEKLKELEDIIDDHLCTLVERKANGERVGRAR